MGNRHFEFSDTHKGLLAGSIPVICWSGFNIVSRFGSTAIFTPFDLAAMRYGVSGVSALPFFIRLVPLREWRASYANQKIGPARRR